MHQRPEPERRYDLVILLGVLALLLFASPLTSWWASRGSPWYLPYLLWLLIILLGAWLQRRQYPHDV